MLATHLHGFTLPHDITTMHVSLQGEAQQLQCDLLCKLHAGDHPLIFTLTGALTLVSFEDMPEEACNCVLPYRQNPNETF